MGYGLRLWLRLGQRREGLEAVVMEGEERKGDDDDNGELVVAQESQVAQRQEVDRAIRSCGHRRSLRRTD